MGDGKSGRANCWYPHVGDRRQMSSFRDLGHLLLDVTGSLCTLSIAKSGAYFTLAEVLFPRWRSGGLYDVRVFPFFFFIVYTFLTRVFIGLYLCYLGVEIPAGR